MSEPRFGIFIEYRSVGEASIDAVAFRQLLKTRKVEVLAFDGKSTMNARRIDSLPLSRKTTNLLMRNLPRMDPEGWEKYGPTVQLLTQYSRRELGTIFTMGDAGLDEIERGLAQIGHTLKQT